MTLAQRVTAVLLAVAIALLAANLIVALSGHDATTPAMADIVSGKNYFSTHSPDGRTIYLWYYEYQGAPDSRNATESSMRTPKPRSG